MFPYREMMLSAWQKSKPVSEKRTRTRKRVNEEPEQAIKLGRMKSLRHSRWQVGGWLDFTMTCRFTSIGSEGTCEIS